MRSFCASVPSLLALTRARTCDVCARSATLLEALTTNEARICALHSLAEDGGRADAAALQAQLDEALEDLRAAARRVACLNAVVGATAPAMQAGQSRGVAG